MRASAVRSGPLERDMSGLVDDVDDHQKKGGGPYRVRTWKVWPNGVKLGGRNIQCDMLN